MRTLCLLALLLPTCASAKSNLNCVSRTGKAVSEPGTLSALVGCQKTKLATSSAAYQAKNHSEPPEELVEAWQDVQRAEVQDYVQRHPDRASLDNPKGLAAEQTEKQPTDSKASPDSKQAKNTQDLAKQLQAESNGGKKGVTPEMTQQINDYLQKNQGSISPDMQTLLNSVQKDGPNLSADTFGKLQDAAKQAKQGGLDLDVDKKTEDMLLAPKDPSPNQN